MTRRSILVLLAPVLLALSPAVTLAASPESLRGITFDFDPKHLEMRVDGQGAGEYEGFRGVLVFAREGLGMIQVGQFATNKQEGSEEDILRKLAEGVPPLTEATMLSGRPKQWHCSTHLDPEVGDDEILTCVRIEEAHTTIVWARTTRGQGKPEELAAMDAALNSLRTK
jgi:hypothetical protein